MTKAFRLSCLSAASLVVLVAGCNSSHMIQPVASLTGNWTFTAQPSPTLKALTLNAGLTSEANGEVIAVAHLKGATCVSASTPITLSGSVDDAGNLTLTSAAFQGSTLKLNAQLNAD